MFKGKHVRFFSLILGLLLMITLLLSGCGSGAAPVSSSSGSSGEAKVINIGWTGPLSGGAAQYGKDTVEGLQMAIDELNGAGGISVSGQKYSFKLIALDDQYKPDMAATNARRLVSENKAPVIYTVHAGGAFALQEFNTDPSGSFLLTAHTSDPTVAARKNPLTYIDSPPYTGQPDPYTQIAMQKFGKKMALIPAVTQYGKDWAAAMDAAWKKQGGTVTGSFPLDYNTETDFYPFISKALATNPDVIYLGGPAQADAMIIKQSKQQGFKGGFIICDQPRFEDMEKVVSLADLNGTIGLLPLNKHTNAGGAKFIDAYKAKYNGKIPTYHNASMYIGMKIIAMGMQKAGSVTDPAKIYTGMKQVFPLKGDDYPYEVDGINDLGQTLIPDKGVLIADGKYAETIPIIPK